MATASSLLTEDQFLCSICLDVFSQPVTIPCGHNFCMTCITKCWDGKDQHQCPVCKTSFDRRPDLSTNTFISEMAAQFKRSFHVKDTGSEQRPVKPGEVPCDFCTGTKLKALKSCLVCQTSYCETHLEPHQRVAALKKHKLINPVDNLEERMCTKHDKVLEMFCKSDQTCICVLCLTTDHMTHKTVPVEEEYGEKSAGLGRMMARVQQMVDERLQKVKEIKHSVDLSKKQTEKVISDSADVFTSLVRSIEKNQADLTELIEKKQEAHEIHAERLIQDLQQEMAELNERSIDLEKLSHTEDHLHLLQSFPSLTTPPPTKDWSEISVHSDLCVGTLRRALSELKERLSKEMDTEIKRLCEVELKTMQKCSVDLTFDPETANASIVLSENCKQARTTNTKEVRPDNQKRFDRLCVLSNQGFTSGRCYYEVQVKNKTDWIIGVAKESVNRKKVVISDPALGCWTICLQENSFWALTRPRMSLPVEKPERVGVFVDYEEGQVTFYDVEAACHIYSFMNCRFTERIHPFFSPHLNRNGKNAAPLIISPVITHS